MQVSKVEAKVDANCPSGCIVGVKNRFESLIEG